MESYKFFPHTADAKFQAYGTTLEEAFANAAKAMASILLEPEKVKPAVEEKITCEGADEKALLYCFLEEFLFLLDTKGFILSDIKKIRIEGSKLTAIAAGDIVGEKYHLHGSVKAITYNEMDIKREDGRVTVQAVVDV